MVHCYSFCLSLEAAGPVKDCTLDYMATDWVMLCSAAFTFVIFSIWHLMCGVSSPLFGCRVWNTQCVYCVEILLFWILCALFRKWLMLQIMRLLLDSQSYLHSLVRDNNRISIPVFITIPVFISIIVIIIIIGQHHVSKIVTGWMVSLNIFDFLEWLFYGRLSFLMPTLPTFE